MSIDRKLVLDLITRRIFTERVERSKSLVLWLVQKSLFNDYVTDRQDCTKHEQRMLLPNNKSMKACQLWCGLPLWNLTSHLFAQIVLHELDLFVKHDLKIKWYGRYVDDFVLIHNDRD
jgi:RNA-directed DNA polymerase